METDMSGWMKERSSELTDITDNSSQYPGIAMAEDGTIYVCWQEYKDRHDTVWAGWLRDGAVQGKTRISGQGEALRPVVCAYGGAVWYAWSECLDGQWQILARYHKNGGYSPVITVARGEALFYPDFLTDCGHLALVFNEQGRGYSDCVLCRLDGNQASGREVVSVSRKSYRPTGCEGGDKNTYVAYDSFDGSSYDILVRVRTAGGWGEEIKVSRSSQWAARPVITATEEGACVCWYEYGDLAAFSYCSADIRVTDGRAAAGEVQVLSSNKNWYHDISAASNSRGTTVFAYTWGKYNINVRYRRRGEPWSEPVVMSYDDTHCAVHPAVMVDEEDNIRLLWQFAYKNGHMDRNACIVYNTMPVSGMDEHFDREVEQSIDHFVQPIPGVKSFGRRTGEETAGWMERNGYGGMHLLFGDIHGQSGISDGVGEIDQYYHYAKVRADLDFTALTDHDCYPDWISQSEWEWMRTTNRLMNTDGELACFLAYEWTPNEYRYDYGHKNIYYRGDRGDIFRSGDIGGMTPFKLFESLKQYDAMAFPHHPAALWGLVSAATDWDFHDPDIQRLVELFSRHANFEDFESESVYTKNIGKLKGHSVQDALARKYRIGFTAGSDSHQMEHGIEGGIFAVFAPAFTREAIYDAMYDRFTYATTGARILASLKIGTAHMGQEITAPKGEPLLLDVSVLGTGGGRVEIVKNNQVLSSVESPDGCCDFSYEDKEWDSDDYYYVRVVQEDGHMAWTSPIWVTGR